MLAHGAFLGIEKVPALGGINLAGVLYLEYLAAGGLGVKDHHVELPHRKLQHEDLAGGSGDRRLKQDDVLEHAAHDLGANTRDNSVALGKR